MKKTSNTSERLAQIMREKNLKQAEVLELCKPICEKYGVKLDSSGLSQYVTGKHLPRQNMLTVLSEALGVSEAWLMGYEEEEPTFSALDEDETDIIKAYRNFDRRTKHLMMAYLYKLSNHMGGVDQF